MALEANKYDAVIASFCLPHLTNIKTEKLIADISKILCQGGLLYLSCMEGSGSGFDTTSFSSNDLIFFNYYSEEFLQKVFIKNGPEITKIERDVYPEIDGSETIDLFIFAHKKSGAGDGV